MGERVSRAAAKAGVAPEGVPVLLDAYHAAMWPRHAGARALPSEQHPAFLHPGRTLLILLDDLGEVDSRVLAVGALAESRDLQLRVSSESALEVLGAFQDGSYEIHEWWRGLPGPEWGEAGTMPDASGGDFLERVVTAPRALQRVVLAEALDHLRHAHLWDSPSARIRAAALAEDVLGPLADRLDPTLARRYAWWTRRVGQALRKGRP